MAVFQENSQTRDGVTIMPKKQREKVVAEITTFHLSQLAQAALGRALSREEAIRFLNDGDRAYHMWKHMMHAGEAYIQSTIRSTGTQQRSAESRA